MEAKRLTITRFFAMFIAPRDKVTDTTIGSSSGVSPTASATALDEADALESSIDLENIG